MKKILFCLFFILSVVCANAQSDYDYLKYQFREQNKKNRIERQERIENGNDSFATGLNVGYSSENFLKIAWKIGSNKTMLVFDGGIMTPTPKSIKENENYVRYNNFTINLGLTYNILPNFYIGILSGVNHIRYDETINSYETKTILNDDFFNYGITLGCIFKNVDLSVSYSKTEQFSIQIGFLIRE